MPDVRLSRYVYWCCVALMCYVSFFFYPKWQKPRTEATISWDVSGYYWYLPSLFIYKDLKHQSFKDSVLKKYHCTDIEYLQGIRVDNGNYVMKYSSGMALMYLPFFTAAHLLAGALGYPRDGFSLPYQFAIQFGGLLVALIGLWYLRKLLLLFYTDRVVAIVMVVLVAGSNYINYAAIDCGMTHSWLFTVYVFLLLNTVYFHRSYEMKYAVRTGLLVGVAALTRPPDIISCLIPLLWGMDGITIIEIKNRITLFIKQYRSLLAAGICAGCIISIQLVYWKYVSGHWIVYSYADQKMYLRSPNFMNYTFSYRSGWLVYTPVMMLSFAGIVPFLLKGRNRVAIVLFFLLNYYLVCTWNIWWYGGRAMIQSYPVLLFCIASLTDAALNRKLLLFVLTPFVLVCIYFNVWVTVQEHVGKLYDSDTMNGPYFRRVAGRWSAPERTIFLRDITEIYEQEPTDARLVYVNNFKNDTGRGYYSDKQNGQTYLQLDKDIQVTPVCSFRFNGKEAAWLRIQATFHAKDKEGDLWKMTQMVVQLTSDAGVVKQNMIRVYRLLDANTTRSLALDVKLPSVQYDSVKIFFMNAGGDKQILISDIKVWSFIK